MTCSMCIFYICLGDFIKLYFSSRLPMEGRTRDSLFRVDSFRAQIIKLDLVNLFVRSKLQLSCCWGML